LLASVVGIVQFIIQYRSVRVLYPHDIYDHLTSYRIHGMMGHWMHFGGQQMLIFTLLLAYLLLAAREDRNSKIGNRNWKIETGNSQPPATPENRAGSLDSNFDLRISTLWWVVLAFAVLSILLNFTRGVWLGCFLAGVYILARWRPKWVLALPVLMALAYVGAPSLVRERIHMALHPTEDPALSIRFEMWDVALRMIRAHPWVGVGPNNIEEVYDLYRQPGSRPLVGYRDHFHNDYLQFGAERGLPCLAAWIWLMGALGWYTWKLRGRLARASGRQVWIADAALAAGLAFLAEGCFEFNFGTSPVLMVFLFVTATPFIAARVAASGSVTQPGKGECIS